jgi:uncharacterized protein DUF4154
MNYYSSYAFKKRPAWIRTIRYITLGILFFLDAGFSENRQIDKASEYNLKAAFIYNFTKYIEWNGTADENDFIIGIIGASSINAPLVEIVKTETVNGKKITIKQFSNPSDISFCNILFISRNTNASLPDILAKTDNKGTLVVSEQENYAKEGSAINFVIVNRKLKFQANVNAINDAGLTASSQLLKLAIIVK